MVNDNGQVFVLQVLVEKIAQLRLRPDEVDPHGQSTAREDRSPNLRLRCFVGTYCIKRNVDEHGLALGYLAASFTSRTARPLYSPHLAQARWGSFFSWQLGHSERPTAVRKSWERRSAVRRVEWRLFGFGMVLFLS